MRIGLDFVARIYDDAVLAKIEWNNNPIMDARYGGRLSKGTTWSIGGNDRERFYITRYADGSQEIWVRRKGRTGMAEETLACLLPNEVAAIVDIVKASPEPIKPAPKKDEDELAEESV